MKINYSHLRILLFTGSGLMLGACDAKQAASENTKADVVKVGVYRIASHAFSRRVEFAATVQPLKQVVLMAKLPGEVRRINAVEGDAVAAGQALIELDQRDFLLALKQARAQLAAAGAGVEAAAIGLDAISKKQQRLDVLRKQDVVPESQYEDVESGTKGSAAQLRVAEAQRALAEVAVEAAQANLGYTVVRAPFDGVVGSRMVDLGARVQMMPPTPLMMIVDLSSVKVVGGIAESDIRILGKGAKVTVYVDALGDKPFEGVVERVDPMVDPRTRTANVEVVLANDDGQFRPGMSARAIIDVGSTEAASIPEDAVIKSELGSGKGGVFVVSGEQALRREVTIGLRDGELLEVREGLKTGDVIVRGGQEKLRDGQRIAVQKAHDGRPVQTAEEGRQ